MKVFYIKFCNIVNSSYVYTKPVLAKSLEEAMHKARDYPYTNNWEMVC